MKKFQTKVVGIVNFTPDSFSDGGRYNSHMQALDHVSEMIANGADIIDVGAESTRPSGIKVSVQEEQDRLDGLLQKIYSIACENNILVSLDSRNYDTLKKFEKYYHIVNDVTGFDDKRIIDLHKRTQKEVIFMRSISVPVIKNKTIGENVDPVAYVQDWLDQKLQFLKDNKVDLGKLIFDPGIGFGLGNKNDLVLIKRLAEINTKGLRMMIGHSRKSFLSVFGEDDASLRDPETHVLSSYLINLGVDYIRVHDVRSTYRIKKLTEMLYR